MIQCLKVGETDVYVPCKLRNGGVFAGRAVHHGTKPCQFFVVLQIRWNVRGITSVLSQLLEQQLQEQIRIGVSIGGSGDLFPADQPQDGFYFFDIPKIKGCIGRDIVCCKNTITAAVKMDKVIHVFLAAGGIVLGTAVAIDDTTARINVDGFLPGVYGGLCFVKDKEVVSGSVGPLYDKVLIVGRIHSDDIQIHLCSFHKSDDLSV